MQQRQLREHLDWLSQTDIKSFLHDGKASSPWFRAYSYERQKNSRTVWFSALAPAKLVPKLLENVSGWDFRPSDGGPSIWTSVSEGVEHSRYVASGNEQGIEPLVMRRTFHGLREDYLELAEEFRLFHNLYPEPNRKRYVLIDDNGDESEAARYTDDLFEIRTDLVLEFSTVKGMAVAVYVDCVRDSRNTLEEMAVAEARVHESEACCAYSYCLVPFDFSSEDGFKSFSRVLGKKFILPQSERAKDGEREEQYQEFIIGDDATGTPIRFTCDPGKLANYFGLNPGSPNYLTPVFFRREVLAKYYAEPNKYSVEDGYLRCGGLWGLRMDNDHSDCVVVFLGDLGTDLSEKERNYWLSFNIPSGGRKISKTTFKRGFLAEFAEPNEPDLAFKSEYHHFNEDFQKAKGWTIFLPLHKDDEHYLTSLRLLANDNQSEFDSQLIALTKLLVDSLNEKAISKDLRTLEDGDKGITKMQKFFVEMAANGFESHVRFLRVLQDLRSKSAAHRKGSSYEELVLSLQIADEGPQKVFAGLLTSGVNLIKYLRETLLPETIG